MPVIGCRESAAALRHLARAFPKRGNAEASNHLIASCPPLSSTSNTQHFLFVVCTMPPQSDIFVNYEGPRLSRDQKLVVRSRAMVSFRAKNKVATNQSAYSPTT